MKNIAAAACAAMAIAPVLADVDFTAGRWMAPYGTGNDAFYAAHKDWFLHDKDGKPIQCWNGKYTLDPTAPGGFSADGSICRAVGVRF